MFFADCETLDPESEILSLFKKFSSTDLSWETGVLEILTVDDLSICIILISSELMHLIFWGQSVVGVDESLNLVNLGTLEADIFLGFTVLKISESLDSSGRLEA